MINSQIGYIICESDFSASTKLTPKRINGKLVAEAILQTADEKNRNGRYYAEEELFPQLTAKRTVELLNAGYLRAECGHPLSKDLQRQSTIDDTRTCARFLKLWTEGKNVMAHVVGTNSPLGQAFNADLEEGCMPAWSLRALGSVNNTARGAEVKNLRLITWDNVIYPSHPGAYTKGLVTESALLDTNQSNVQRVLQERFELNINEQLEADRIGKSGILIPVTNENVLSFLQHESSNLKFVKECFDFAYTGIQTNNNGTRVLLTTNAGDTLVINAESYVHNQLMNYADDFGITECYDEPVVDGKMFFDMQPQLEEVDIVDEGLRDAYDTVQKGLSKQDIAKTIGKAALSSAAFGGGLYARKKLLQKNGIVAADMKEEKDNDLLEDVELEEVDDDALLEFFGKKNSADGAPVEKWYDKNAFKGDLTGKDIAKNIGTAAAVGAAGVVGAYGAKKAIKTINDRIEKKREEKDQSHNESFFDDAVDDAIENVYVSEFTRFKNLTDEQKRNVFRAGAIAGSATIGGKVVSMAINKAENKKSKNNNEEESQEESYYYDLDLDSVED